MLPGIHVRFGEGHTLGQQFIIVETGRGRIVVSGDCVYGARNILGNNNDGVYMPSASASAASGSSSRPSTASTRRSPATCRA